MSALTQKELEDFLAAPLELENIDSEEAVIEDVDEDDDDGDDDDDYFDDFEGLEDSSGIRRAMLKLGMMRISDVSRVCAKKSKNTKFVISKPEVFKSPRSDTYIIIGESKNEHLSSQLQTQAAEQCVAQEDEDIDETGMTPIDIELVRIQAGVSRLEAVKAIRAADGDIVSAILELTK